MVKRDRRSIKADAQETKPARLNPLHKQGSRCRSTFTPYRRGSTPQQTAQHLTRYRHQPSQSDRRGYPPSPPAPADRRPSLEPVSGLYICGAFLGESTPKLLDLTGKRPERGLRGT